MTIPEILKTYKTIAVVGLSSRVWRPSFAVTEYMKSQGYTIIPVNPNEDTVLGEPSVASLDQIGPDVGIVNVFRRPEFVPAIVRQAIRIDAKVVWMQEGVVHEAAAAQARAAGLDVVMDRCILKEHMKLGHT
jgi:hypothetical protein